MTIAELNTIITRWNLTPKIITAVTGATVDQQKSYRFGRTPIAPAYARRIKRLDEVLAKIREN